MNKIIHVNSNGVLQNEIEFDESFLMIRFRIQLKAIELRVCAEIEDGMLVSFYSFIIKEPRNAYVLQYHLMVNFRASKTMQFVFDSLGEYQFSTFCEGTLKPQGSILKIAPEHWLENIKFLCNEVHNKIPEEYFYYDKIKNTKN